jgi:thiosulfate/3-mercaptopyruvate sulfurtransferase
MRSQRYASRPSSRSVASPQVRGYGAGCGAAWPVHLPQEQAQRPGHIPGARNIPWVKAVDPETGAFLPTERLRSLYEGQGLTPDLDVVAYCRIGERSAHTWFVLHELLGYPRARNYDGSWTEWGSMVGVPIER